MSQTQWDNRRNGEFSCLLDNEKQIRADIWGSVQSAFDYNVFSVAEKESLGGLQRQHGVPGFPWGLIS